ncbi:MAG TPA: hypothetical protein PKJ19_03040 [Flavobacteriales bacterium]|nr:hypothetical protein [Flavobacteriales bacterium]HNU56090.1 hypothetical protein [Flavobacteriales bacterium]
MTHSTLRKNASRRPKKSMTQEIAPGPREASIQFILGYSKALKLVDAPPVGEIAIILN